MTTGIRCEKCGVPYAPHLRTCPACGNLAMRWKCPTCGQEYDGTKQIRCIYCLVIGAGWSTRYALLLTDVASSGRLYAERLGPPPEVPPDPDTTKTAQERP